MIVQCSQCKTKFRIADAKVGPSGVRVRCSRCSHVFVVKPASESVAASARSDATASQPDPARSPPPGRPPSALIGPAIGDQPVRSFAEARPSGISSAGSLTPYPIPSMVPEPASAAPPPGVPLAPASPGLAFGAIDPSVALGFSSAPPVEAPATRSIEFPSADPTSAPPAPSLAEKLGFADPPLAANALGGLPHWNAPSRPVSSSGAGRLRAPSSGGFVPPAPLPYSALDEISSAAGPPSVVPSATSFDSKTGPIFAPQSAIPDGRLSDSGDIPGLFAPRVFEDDPFQSIGHQASSPPSGGVAATGFDSIEGGLNAPGRLPSRGEEGDRLGAGFGDDGLPKTERVEIGRAKIISSVGSAGLLSDQALVDPARDRALARPPPPLPGPYPGAQDAIGRWPTLVGLVLGLVATFLVVWLPSGARSELGPLSRILRMQSGDEHGVANVFVRNAHVTAYPTAHGKRLLVVAGDAFNEGTEAIEGVEAVCTMSLEEEEEEIESAWIGLTLGEDQLREISSPQDVVRAFDAAISRLGHAVDRVSLAPGSTRPFMVLFPEVPMEVERRSFRVHLRRRATLGRGGGSGDGPGDAPPGRKSSGI